MTSDTTGATSPAEPPSVAEHHLHPAYLILAIGRSVRTLIPVIALAVWKAPWWVWVVLGLVVVLGAFADWWMRSYQVSDGVLRVRAGLLHRTVSTVPVSRITALETERGLLQRILGVSALHVQTPGDAAHASVHLSCLSAARLTEVRAALSPGALSSGALSPGTAPPGTASGALSLGAGSVSGDRLTATAPSAPTASADHRQAANTTAADVRAAQLREALRRHWSGEAAPSSDARVVAVVGTRDLLIAAVTGTSVPIIVAGGLAAWTRAQDVLPESQREWLRHAVFGRGVATLLVLLGLVLLAVAVGITTTSLRLAGFTLIRDGDRLRTTRGLLAQRTGSVAVDRIQAIRLVEGFWRRRFGLCEVQIEAAGVGGGPAAARMIFPVVPIIRVGELLAAALPELPSAPARLTPTPRRARRRYFTKPLWVAAALTAIALLLLPAWWALLAALPFPIAIWVAIGRWRDAGWSVGADRTVFRWRRVLARHTVIARTTGVQYTQQHSGWFSRRAGLCGFRIALSSRRIAGVPYLEQVDADRALHLIGRRSQAVERLRPSNVAAVEHLQPWSDASSASE